MLLIGELALWVALLTSGWAAIVSLAGALRGRRELTMSGGRAMIATFAMLALSLLVLFVALAQRDLSVSYVAEHTGLTTPRSYAIAALWTGQAGSLLLSAAALALCAVLASRSSSASPSTLNAVLGALILFLVAALCADMNPFVRLETVPLDGRGMNPQLQHPAVLVHPPLMLLGVAAASVPFACAVAALATPAHATATTDTRKWLTAAWVLLSAGTLLGMWWAYSELGWGGLWAWDAVQSASLATLLATAAAVHAVRQSERSGAMDRRTWGLVMLPFLFASITVFVDRGAPLPSVHAFARPARTVWFGGLLALVTIVSVAAFARRRDGGGRTREAPAATTDWSRRAVLVVAAGLLLAMAFATAWGLGFPLLASWVSGSPTGVGAPYFARVLWPAATLLTIGLAVAVVITARDVVRGSHGSSRLRATGALATHAGVLLLCVALVVAGARAEHEVVVNPGQTFSLTDPLGRPWRFVSQGTSVFRRPGQEVTAVALEVARGSSSHGLLSSEERQYVNRAGDAIFHPTMEIGRRSTLLVDVQFVLMSLEGETATLRIGFVPFAIWIWIGGGLAIAGAAMSWWSR